MSDKILKLDQAQTLYQDLRGRIDALPTDEDITVTDVQVNGTSVVTDGVANVPVASSSAPGVVTAGQTYGYYGVSVENGRLQTQLAEDGNIKSGSNSYRPIVPTNQHKAVFYGLAKAAGDATQSASSNTVGTYTDDAKQKIQNMLGVTDLISTEESSTATAAHALNSLFLMGGKLYRATSAITIGDAVVEGTNCEVVKVEDVFVKNTDYAYQSHVGVVKIANQYGIDSNSANGTLLIKPALESLIKNPIGTEAGYKPIVPNTLPAAIFYGLSKVAGVDLANETVTLGTYPETSKTAIRSLIGAAAASDIPSVPVQDVQVNGTSVLSNGIANVPVGNNSILGVIQGNASEGVGVTNAGKPYIQNASVTQIKAGLSVYSPITPSNQDASAFYALAKLAGADMASSSNPVGTYTDAAKTAIRNMLGAASPDVVAISDTQPTSTDTKVWLPETQAAGVEVPTYAEFTAGLAGKVSDVQMNGTSVVTSGVANIPAAGIDALGVVRVSTDYGLNIYPNGTLRVWEASHAQVKSGTNQTRPLVPDIQHESTFYGLAKAAGDTTQSQSDNAVGTYTDGAKTAIRSMLGAVGDVQVNGTSVVSSGVANVPVASDTELGVVKVSSNYGTGVYAAGGNVLFVSLASSNDVKLGTQYYKPIVPYNQHISTFYGLAKAAGDTTMTSSSNAVGTYTDSAKASIKSMLGIVDGSTGTVDITGTTPSITAVENTRYVCGEVSTLSFTPAVSGICIVRFTSGSTATVLTVPNTVKFPEWFDITALEADTIYEICITDGIYGAVMSWAL